MKYLLIVQLPDKEEQKIALEGDQVTLGRSSGNGIQLSVPEISSRHLEFVKVGGGYKVIDTGSTNGTKVNGARIREHQLQDGDRLLIGQVLRADYSVVADEATLAQEAAPAKPKVVEVTAGPAVPTVLMERPSPPARPAMPVPAATSGPPKPPLANPKIPRPATATPAAPPNLSAPTVRKLKPPGMK